MKKKTTIIITVAVCISFVVNSIMATWEQTRRSADEIAKIKLADTNAQEVCRKNGGKPFLADNGEMKSCIYKD
jgi:hypothetical protein